MTLSDYQEREQKIMHELESDPCMQMDRWSKLITELHNTRWRIHSMSISPAMSATDRKRYESRIYNVNY